MPARVLRRAPTVALVPAQRPDRGVERAVAPDRAPHVGVAARSRSTPAPPIRCGSPFPRRSSGSRDRRPAGRQPSSACSTCTYSCAGYRRRRDRWLRISHCHCTFAVSTQSAPARPVRSPSGRHPRPGTGPPARSAPRTGPAHLAAERVADEPVRAPHAAGDRAHVARPVHAVLDAADSTGAPRSALRARRENRRRRTAIAQPCTRAHQHGSPPATRPAAGAPVPPRSGSLGSDHAPDSSPRSPLASGQAH